MYLSPTDFLAVIQPHRLRLIFMLPELDPKYVLVTPAGRVCDHLLVLSRAPCGLSSDVTSPLSIGSGDHGKQDGK